MTAHELARLLLAGPDLPVYFEGFEMNGDDPLPKPSMVTRAKPDVLYQRTLSDGTLYGDLEFERSRGMKDLERRAVVIR